MTGLKLVTVNQLLMFSSTKNYGKMSLVNNQAMIILILFFPSCWKSIFKRDPWNSV